MGPGRRWPPSRWSAPNGEGILRMALQDVEKGMAVAEDSRILRRHHDRQVLAEQFIVRKPFR